MAATVDSVPALVHDEKDEKHSSRGSFADEKGVYQPEKVNLDDAEEVGDVFNDVRLIDLGEDGHERPIETDADYATRLVSLDDDPTIRWFTFRMWFLGLGLSCFAAVLGQIFYFRPQTISVSQLFIQIISFILGRALEYIIPGPSELALIKTSDNAFWRFMNHGHFNMKEHVAITIMSSTASSSALAISIFASQELYYYVETNVAVGIFTLIASQLIGYGFAGLFRTFLVYPTFAVYPQVMPTVQLFEALHRGDGMMAQSKRKKFFWYIFLAIFVWEWFPEYIAPTLTGISIFCLANRKSAWFTRIFGGAAGNEGLGAFSLCLDWAYIGSGGGSIGSLFTPLSTQLSLYGGCAVCMIAFCACFARNTWNTQNFPFLTQLLFYENGTEYNQLLILNDDFTLNEDKLAEQGLPWYAASQLLYKISRTVYIGAAITHFLLWHSKTVYKLIRGGKESIDDPHYKKMQVYKEINNWWYFGVFLICLGIGIGTTYGAKSQLPAWATLIALLFAWLLVPVIGTLYATVGYAPSIENMIQMLGGALVPGKPVANMYFTMYGYQPVVQAYTLCGDLKIGQYTKLPPRATFTVQTVGAIVGGLLNFIIMKVVIRSHFDLLRDVQGSNIWSGQQVQSFNSAAIAWGALGKPLYATGTRYGFVPYMLLVGLLFPIPFWLLHRWYPKVGFNNVFTPILTAELGYLSVGINSSVFTSFVLALFSQWYLRKYRATWFRKYNFLLSAALDGGTSVMIFVFTFAVGGAGGKVINFPNWALNPKGNPDYCLRLTD
ncbi:OPT oligopeptide transporter [Mycena indigotica]|uniref:OPT oligopeptide transporter n=1 Tax=Mycena indigotica TaxID=2126181 RepID=A0A8H6S1Q5_9AGAR|nr:OPT oligopeptide transporter [Mycena indigotica]KAF7290827.1 OPT oligopeptide transporter [Mycena indigotica]